MDVMVHVDPEDDLKAKPNTHLPSRPVLLAHLAERLGDPALRNDRVVFHYLDGKVEAEIYLSSDQGRAGRAEELQARCNEPFYNIVHS